MTEYEQLLADAEAAATELAAAAESLRMCQDRYDAAEEAMNAARTAIAQYEQPEEL